MINIGVSLVNPETGEESQHWDYLPTTITHLGEERTGAIVGSEFKGGFLLVNRYCENENPYGSGATVVSETARFENNNVIVTRTYSPPPLEVLRNSHRARIKDEATKRILEYCPQYKQANLTAQAAELALTFPSTKGEDLPEPYKTAWVEGQKIWGNIKKIREHSNLLEQELSAVEDADALVSWKSYGWPEI